MKLAESCSLYRRMQSQVSHYDIATISRICKTLRVPQRTLSVSCYNFFAAKAECQVEPDDIILVSAAVNLACRVCETARPVEKILHLAGDAYSIEVDQTTRPLYLDSVSKTEMDISLALDFNFEISEVYSRLEDVCKRKRSDILFSKRCWILLNDIMLTPLSIYFTRDEMILASVFVNHLASLPESERDASEHSLFMQLTHMLAFEESFPAVEFVAGEILSQIRSALVVGCGGLGSEVIKILRNYSIAIKALDFDRIETSNLNRQFFFTSKDSHGFKSQTIARKIQCAHAVMRVEDLDNVDLDSFDVVFSCLDSISSRMELNYKFMGSNCPLMVDCGAEGMQWHVKRVTDHEPCLYCIKDLYNSAPEPFLCSLGSLDGEINAQNRERHLRSTVFKAKEQHKSPEPSTFIGIANVFNQKAPEHLRTSAFEVEGIYRNIVPSVCTTNSICAGYAVLMALDHRDYDFVCFDGAEDPFAQRTRLARDPLCFVCKMRSILPRR